MDDVGTTKWGWLSEDGHHENSGVESIHGNLVDNVGYGNLTCLEI